MTLIFYQNFYHRPSPIKLSSVADMRSLQQPAELQRQNLNQQSIYMYQFLTQNVQQSIFMN